MPFINQNKTYTHPHGLLSVRVSSSTYMTVDLCEYVLTFYDSCTRKSFGYLKSSVYDEFFVPIHNVTQELSECFMATNKDFLIEMGNVFLYKVFDNKDYKKPRFRKTNKVNTIYKDIFDRHFNNSNFFDIEVKITEYELELRRIKINKLKIKVKND